MFSRKRSFGFGAAALFAALGLQASLASAEPPPCPTWFPDFRCERHGRYEGFVPPMMHPYLFEDPFITTGLSAWGIWHQFTEDSVVNGGNAAPGSITSGKGDLWVAALQARVAITDRVAFIATKDGWADFSPGLQILNQDDGFTDISAGFKVAAIDDRERNLIVSPSLRFQLNVGDRGVLQGWGTGVFIPDISVGWGLDKFHVLADFGGQFPLDTDLQSTSLFYHLHLDYAVHQYFVPFFEVGGFQYLDGGDGSNTLGLKGGGRISIQDATDALDASHEEGYDYANLGMRGVGGEHVIAWSVGVRVPVTQHLILGVAYERPFSPSVDIINQRASANVTLEF